MSGNLDIFNTKNIIQEGLLKKIHFEARDEEDTSILSLIKIENQNLLLSGFSDGTIKPIQSKGKDKEFLENLKTGKVINPLFNKNLISRQYMDINFINNKYLLHIFNK